MSFRGDHEVHAELPDGRQCYLPLAWTDRQPRPAVTVVRGKPVRLTVAGLCSLAAWTRSRTTSGQKLDSADRDAEKGRDELVEQSAAVDAVVGQARASRVERPARRGKRRQGQ